MTAPVTNLKKIQQLSGDNALHLKISVSYDAFFSCNVVGKFKIGWRSPRDPTPAATTSKDTASCSCLHWLLRAASAQPSSAAPSGPSSWDSAASTAPASRTLYQLPSQPAAAAGGTLAQRSRVVQGGWHGPQLSWHSSQHSLSTGPAPLLRDQRQSQQPGPPARAPRPAQAEFEPSVTQTATKDLQKGALPPAFAQTVFARKCRNSSMTLAIVVIDTGIVFVKFLFFFIYSKKAVYFSTFHKLCS